MKNTRFILGLVILLVASVLPFSTPTARADTAVYTSFEHIAPFTPGSAFGIPGVTFNNEAETDIGMLFSWTYIDDLISVYNINPFGTIVMTFDRNQPSVSFDWASCGVPLQVETYLGGNLVDNLLLPEDPIWSEGHASLAGPIDEVRMTANCFAIDHLRYYGPDGPWDPGDDRLNPEPAAPAAAYCVDGSIHVYNRDGVLAALATGRQIQAALLSDEANPLLAASDDGQVQLYFLDGSGEYQMNVVNGAELYVFRWLGCPMQHSVTEVFSTATGERLVYEED